ncbi:MAG: hypothetical protein JWP82_1103, partial [Humibacillus sp.]|nr:hypothetical protein [Humibacillus sp.]
MSTIPTTTGHTGSTGSSDTGTTRVKRGMAE